MRLIPPYCMKPDAMILHPRPWTAIHERFISAQAMKGLYLRMALLTMVLEEG